MDGPCRCFLFFIKLFFYASFSSFLLLGLYRFALLVLLLHLLRWLYLVALVLFRRIFFGIPLTDIKFSQDSGTFIFIYLFFFWNIFASILEDAWRILWRCSRPIMAIDYFLFISVVNDRNLFNEKSPLDHFLIDDILRPIRSNFLIQFHYYSNKLNWMTLGIFWSNWTCPRTSLVTFLRRDGVLQVILINGVNQCCYKYTQRVSNQRWRSPLIWIADYSATN